LVLLGLLAGAAVLLLPAESAPPAEERAVSHQAARQLVVGYGRLEPREGGFSYVLDKTERDGSFARFTEGSLSRK